MQAVERVVQPAFGRFGVDLRIRPERQGIAQQAQHTNLQIVDARITVESAENSHFDSSRLESILVDARIRSDGSCWIAR